MPDQTYVVVKNFPFAGAEFRVGDVVADKDAAALAGARPDLFRFCRAVGARHLISTPAPATAEEN